MPRYRCFDRVVESDLELAELPPAGPNFDGPADFNVVEGVRPDHCVTHSLYHWCDDAGHSVSMLGRRGEHFVLRFPFCGEFEFDEVGRNIRMIPFRADALAEAARLLADQLVPRLVGQARLVVHAAAVQGPEGTAWLFIGDTGTGKSTTAAAALKAGFEVLSDDCVLIEEVDGEWQCLAAYPSLKLDADTIRTLGLSDTMADVPLAGLRKKRLLLRARSPRPSPIGGIVLLQSGKRDGFLERAKGATAVMSLSRQRFVLNPARQHQLRSQLTELARLVDSGTPIFNWRPKSPVSALPAAIADLIDHVGSARTVP